MGYKYPPKPEWSLPFARDPEEHTPETFHEILGKFRFEVNGTFYGMGYDAEKEFFDNAFNLHLVGWIKVREKFVLGHVQGDSFALSYYRKWLEEKHLSPEAGKMEWTRFWEMSLGIAPQDLKYTHLHCVKDRRRYGSKKNHQMRALQGIRTREHEQLSYEQQQEELALIDASCVRNY